MALVSANGLNAFDSQLCMPRVGAWHADLRVDDPDALVGQVTISIAEGALTLVGTAIRSGEFVGTAQVRVVGGAGGLSLTAKPAQYIDATIGIVLGDLLAGVGEKLSPTSDQSVIGVDLKVWTTVALPVGAVIATLLQSAAPGAAWRVLPDGTVWVGNETWADAGLDPTTYEVLDRSYEDGTMLVAVAAPMVIAGTTFEGGRVSYVEHDVPHVAGVTMRVWFEDAATSNLGRPYDAFAALVRAVPVTIDHRARYVATVIAQSTDRTTVDVVPDDARIPTMMAIPLWFGLPDTTAALQITPGVGAGRVLLGWMGGDPTKPYAEAFDGTNLAGLTIAGGTEGVARTDDSIQATLSGLPPAPAGLYALAAALLATGLFTPNPTPPPPSELPDFDIDGEITSGSSIVKIG